MMNSIKNIFSEKELDEKSTVAFFATVQTEGSREVTERIKCIMVENKLSHLEDNTDEVYDKFSEIYDKMCGYSDYYSHRVIESIEVTYSPNDIYLENVLNYDICTPYYAYKKRNKL